MNVLQAAGAIIRRRDADVALVQIVPRTGKIRRSQITIEKLPLELEPDHDVKVVCNLVRLDTNEMRLDPIDRTAKCFQRNIM